MTLGPIHHPTDAALVTRTLAGDISAFEALVRRYRGLAFGLAYHQLGRFEDAEDAAQEAMVEAYLKLRHLREPERFAGWLRRIVAGKAIEVARRRREEPVAPEAIEAAQARDAGPLPRVLETHVRDALAQLPPAVRLATTLFYVDGYSYQEIATHLGVPASTVRGRLQRARSSLRDELVALVSAGLRKARPGEAFMERVMSKIQSIKVYEQTDERGRDIRLLHLIDDHGRRLNMYVGLSEALQVNLQLEGKATPRPMTYQLMTTVLDGFGLKVTRAEVTELKDQTFFALLAVKGNGQTKTFDARPSDAINLALAAGAEIHVNDKVLDEAAVTEEPGRLVLKPELRMPDPTLAKLTKWTEQARRAVAFAQEAAASFGEDYVGTEHLLLGLVQEGDNTGARVLHALGVSAERVRTELERQMTRSAGGQGRVLTPRARRAIDLAHEEAQAMGCDYIGTEHLLLGLVQEGDGLAARVLTELGIDLERTRREIQQSEPLPQT
jgi:RNA polymerase sigma factor (sigma-70 family)